MTWTLHDLRADFPEIVENQLAYNHMKQDLVHSWLLLDPRLRHCGGHVRCCGYFIIPLHRDPPPCPAWPTFR